MIVEVEKTQKKIRKIKIITQYIILIIYCAIINIMKTKKGGGLRQMFSNITKRIPSRFRRSIRVQQEPISVETSPYNEGIAQQPVYINDEEDNELQRALALSYEPNTDVRVTQPD
jgi:hypothetical protein